MALNLNQLRIFYACGKHQTFSDAAEELLLTQPAVTIQIRELEAYLGMGLFHRRGKRIELTEAGRILFKYAQKIFDLAALAERSMWQLKDLKTGILKVGTNKVYIRYMMPRVVSSFQEKYPAVQVSLYGGSSAEIVKSLIDHNIELGVIPAKSSYPPQLKVIPFTQEELVLALARDHPLNRKPKISLEDLAKESLVIREKGSYTREIILDRYREAKIKPHILTEANSWDFIKEQVIAGNGIAFLAEWTLKEELAAGSLNTRVISEGPFRFSVDIVYLKKRSISPLAEAFISLLLETKK